MKHEGNNSLLEKVDLIRLNRLVRFQTDYSGFRDWYQPLDTDEQAALIGQLCNFAYQAGVDDSAFQTAAQDAGLIQEQEFLALMKRVRGPSGLNVRGIFSLGSIRYRSRA